MTTEDVLLRLGLASVAGILLGLDREYRGLAAGIRTHALISLSSALIMVSALLIHADFQAHQSSDVDPLRVVQGLAQAVGFVAAGAIFFAQGNVHNLTTAANLWLAAALGIAAGAGQYRLVGAGLGIGLILLVLVRLLERFVPGSGKAGN